VAVDSGGLIYVADRGNETIRRVTAGGTVTTVAGLIATPGAADGTGSAARFNGPLGIAIDPAGRAYVADGLNSAIRKVTPEGVVTTFAGIAGSGGSADGLGSAARFRSPRGICTDAAGAIYIAEGSYSAPLGNHTIRRITPAGLVSTLAGSAGSAGSADGNGQAARFRGPYGIAAALAGNLYVADTLNHTIRKIMSDGTVTTIAGLAGNSGTADGTGSSARFNYPTGVAVDTAENIYVADRSNQAIRKITPAGDVTTFAGVAGVSGAADGQGPLARFSQPTGLTIDAVGNLYVADEANHKIRKITPGAVVSTVAGTGFVGSNDGAAANAQFRNPVGVATDLAGNVYVADSGNNLVRRIDLRGVVTTLAGSAELRGGNTEGAGANARFGGVNGLAVDNRGNIFVASSYAHTVRIGHATTFPLWASAFFSLQELSQPAVSDGLADPDRDGVPNLLEYAFNTNPRASASADRIQPAIDPTDFSLLYPKLRGLSDVTYAIEGSADLIGYASVTVEETVVADNDAKQTIRGRIPRMGTEKLFLRRRVLR
jgi:sugar lactone lactonase YvrE